MSNEVYVCGSAGHMWIYQAGSYFLIVVLKRLFSSLLYFIHNYSKETYHALVGFTGAEGWCQVWKSTRMCQSPWAAVIEHWNDSQLWRSEVPDQGPAMISFSPDHSGLLLDDLLLLWPHMSFPLCVLGGGQSSLMSLPLIHCHCIYIHWYPPYFQTCYVAIPSPLFFTIPIFPISLLLIDT